MDVIRELVELAAYRKGAGLTQAAAAKKVGVRRETWARWEAGRRKIDDDKLPRVSKVTGLARDVLRPDLAKLMQVSG